MADKISNPAAPAASDGLNFACILDGAGGARSVGWSGIEDWAEQDGPLWVHLDRSSPNTVAWLTGGADIPVEAQSILLAEETRPRAFPTEHGTIVILRGLNLNAGSDPEDMVAIRIWFDETRIISVRQRRLMTPRAIFADLTDLGKGPKSVPAILTELAAKLTEQMNSVVVGTDERLDAVEERLEERNLAPLRSELATLRHSCVILRRYIGPQREALAALQSMKANWMDRQNEASLRETTDRLLRYIEDLDAARDRAIVIRDEIANRLSEDMNRTMYALAVVAGVFLPLGLLTGLLGINVGGMPGVESADAFWITCVVLVVVAVFEIWLFRRLKWI